MWILPGRSEWVFARRYEERDKTYNLDDLDGVVATDCDEIRGVVVVAGADSMDGRTVVVADIHGG